MARFSLSPPSTSSIKQREEQQQQSSKDAPQWKWNYPPQDGYSYRQPIIQHSSTDEESSVSSSDDDSSSSSEEEVEQSNKDDESSNINDEEDEEEEPPHPLGFEKYGKTRFGLSPQSTSNKFNNRNTPTRGDIFNRDDEYAWNALIHIDDEKKSVNSSSLIPTYHLKSRSYIPTSNLLAGATSLQYQEKEKENDDGMEDLLCGMDRIANLVKAASYVQTPRDTTHSQTTTTSTPRSTSKLLHLATICEQQQNQLSTEMSIIQQQRTESYKQSCQGFLLLLKADESKVNRANERINKRLSDIQQIEEKNKQEQLAHEEQLQQQLKAEQRAKEEHDAALAAQSEEERIKHEQHLQSLATAEKEAEEEAAKKTAYITRAKSLITNLETFRSTLSNFDKSKSVSRRRLQFKKIVNGKINTLAHDTNKIIEVSRMVGDAITNATNDDNNNAAQGGNCDPVLSMGKKYLIDLLCSNLIVRVQADGFNGTRGDGFPLANMFAKVSMMCEELNPVLEGHLYMVCPMAIPTLSLNDDSNEKGGESSNNNEDDLMTSLGMIRDKKTGEFESFDKFLNRTEGLISVMANIMSSLPSEHTLLGGHSGALTWLQRFVDLLPPPPAKPLPLLTAPVLVAFLTGAGHMLANKFPNEFIPLLDSITKDVMNRLDDSSVGVPSATRLKKVLEDVGLDGMKKDLPQGAVEGLYDGKGGGNTSLGGSQFKTTAAVAPAPSPSSSSTFGQHRQEQQQPVQTSSPFQSQEAPVSSPFGASTNTSSGSTFGGMSSTTAPMDNSSSSSSAFGGSFGATSMGATTTTQPTQGFAAPTSSPFGGNTQSSPFTTQQAASPFGSTQTSASFVTQSAPAPSPFGTTTNQTSQWQSQPPQQQPQQQQAANSFGSFPQQQQNASPFNSSPSASGGFGQSPFSNTSQQTNTFGSTAPASSPFGNNQQQQPQTSTFGSSAPAASPFGNTQQPQTSTFGSSPFGNNQQQTNTFGSSAPAASPFGNTQQLPQTNAFGSSPFGNTNQQPPQTSTFGSSNNAFGGNNNSFAPSPSPFGNNNNTNNSGQGFGQNNNTSSGNKPPCKFFAQGKCRNGANCKFSHELPPGNQASTGFGGGGFGQQQSNSSPFSGGGSQGFGQNNNSGGGRTKPPCEFFAQGRCRNGANCKFSHSLPPGNQASEFGGGGFGQQQSNPSPFSGGGSQGFGQNNNNNSGGGRTKPPCKFFAQGRCRNGANCKFSHDLPPGNQNQASTGGFGGGGFGQQTNPSPFGGGGFGGPRR